MKLLRPYPDEAVGSMLSRAIRESGLAVPALLEALTGHALFTHSFVVARYPQIAAAFAMGVEEFIRKHTLTAYSLAFMPAEQRSRLWKSALSAEPQAGYMAGLLRNLTSTNPCLKFCPQCVSVEMGAFGETYWHRSHQLPAVTICAIHWCGLLTSTVPLRARLPAPPPHECDGADLCCALPSETQWGIASASVQCLDSQQAGTRDWPRWFRERAAEAGYELAQGSNAGERLSRDLERYYSRPFLEAHRCAVDRQRGLQWPARLLRSCSHGIEPLKHVLMTVFLEAGQEPTAAKAKQFQARGPRRDRSQEDLEAVRRMMAAATALRRTGGQANLTILMRQAGVEDLWRHSYPSLPRLQAWVSAFKKSPHYRRWVKAPIDRMRPAKLS